MVGMIVWQFVLTLLTVYASAIVGLIVFTGVGLFGLFAVDEWESTK